MRAILINHIHHLRRQPFAVIGMMVLTVVFALALGQVNHASPVKVPVFSEELSKTELTSLLQALNEDVENFTFIAEKEEVIKEKLDEASIDVGLQLEKDSYKLFMSATTQNSTLMESHVATVLQNERVLRVAATELGSTPEQLKEKVASASSMFSFSQKSFNEDEFVYDAAIQSLFGFSLFFVVFTVSFTVSTILDQKRNGIWNRMVLSPLTKTQMYLGHVSYSFFIGYVQLAVIFLFFHYVIGVDLYGGFPFILVVIIPYLFALVSLGVLISALATNPRQLDGIIPLIAVSMAMIGGAYWPLEIVQSEALLFLSKLVPMTYGMEMLKGATILEWGLSEFFLPASVLFCMGVLFMGIGLNFMERKASV